MGRDPVVAPWIQHRLMVDLDHRAVAGRSWLADATVDALSVPILNRPGTADRLGGGQSDAGIDLLWGDHADRACFQIDWPRPTSPAP